MTFDPLPSGPPPPRSSEPPAGGGVGEGSGAFGPLDGGGPGSGWSRGWGGAALLLAAVASPALPTWAALLLLVAVAAVWAALRPPRRETVVVGLGLLAAAALLVYGRHAGAAPDLRDPDWRAATLRGYAAAWSALEGEAARAQDVLVAAGLASSVSSSEERLRAFRTLADLAAAQGEGRYALLLVDPDGEPVAWSGEGLLHELRPEEIPRQGRAFEASFGAVTTFVVSPLEADVRRPWRVVAARSFSTDHLPFAPGAFDPLVLDPLVLDPAARSVRWSLVDESAEAAAGASLLVLRGAPTLVVEPAPLPPNAVSPAARLAWAGLALALLTLAAIRGTGLALVSAAPRPGPVADPRVPLRRAGAVVLLAVGGAVSGGLAAGADPAAVASLAAALLLTAAGFALAPRWPRPAGRIGRWLPWAAGAAAALLLGLVALAAQVAVGPLQASSRLAGEPTVLVLRLALAAVAVSLVLLAGGRAAASSGPGPRPATDDRGERWAWISLPLLLAGAAFCDRPWLALPLLALGAGAVARWAGERRRQTAAGLAVLLLLSAVLAAGAWETAERWLLRGELAQRTLPRVGLPAPAAMQREAARVSGFFRRSDLTRFVPRSPQGLGREDLAYLLWRASPLARPNALSRLTVRPLAGTASSFSFGVPLNDLGEVDAEGWADALPVPPAADRLTEGRATLSYRGEPWADVQWSLLPLPGFLLPASESLEEVEAALLRGLPDVAGVAGLPADVTFVFYDADRRPFASPWPQEPPLAGELAADGVRQAVVPTPQGDAWAVARPSGSGWEVLYLPRLAPPRALERVGTHVLGVLLWLAGLALLALLAALPRYAFRDGLRRAVRSYSKRLLLVYTLLLLVPLLLLNGVLVAAMQDRLRQEQRAAGEAALASAQRVVGTYLDALDPGFDLASELDDDLLRWLSQVVRHEINLYWGSEIWASSKPELFAARLLPKRIPGESFAGIAFRGYDLAARTNRVGDVSYLELYAPLRVPGQDVAPRNFFLSMPLLAQQEEVARELAALRRQALLVTAVLIILVSAVGVRLSRSFTRPLTELVEGTRRIAAGATSLDLSPSELELAALVEAVDEMARRIADGRERLLREKQVVERMVEHITSGVVSLDAERRVLMRNRVAAQLLGVEVGERLDGALARRTRLAPLAAWLNSVAGRRGHRLDQRTVRLPALEGGGGSAEASVESVDEGGDGGEREWTLVWVPVPGSGEPSALLVVEDATETLRGQRLEAWAEMARIIAHEIKNPLTPIRLNIEHVQQVWRDRGRDGGDDDRFGNALERCTTNILAQVDELRQIASEFSTYSHIPKIEPRPGDLVAALRELAEPYRAAPPPGVRLEVETDLDRLEARFDPRLFTRAVRNLVENALRASAGGGRVVLRLERRATDAGGAEACIRVLDSGPGMDPALLPRIFDPYFSTHDSGTGLGLPIARRIAEEHGGGIGARNRPGGGLEVLITLPLL